jgi:AcrR family transcriptional regulator
MTGNGPRRRDAGRARGKPINDAILTAALDDIAEHGIGAMSVERIARAAEVNKTTVYRRWPTLGALARAALLHATTELSAAVSTSGSLEGDLRAIAEIVGGMLATSHGQAIARAGMAAHTEMPLDGAMAAAMFDLPEGLTAVVSGAIERGEWDRSIQMDVVVATLVGALVHRTMIERRQASPEWISALVQLLLAGINPRTPSTQRILPADHY